MAKKIKRKCSNCKRTGHYAPRCPKKKTKKKIRRASKATKKKAKKKATKKKATKKKAAKKKATKKKATKKTKKKKIRRAGNKTHSKSLKMWNSLVKRKLGGYIGVTKEGNLSAKKWGIGMSKDGLKVCTFWGKLWDWAVVKHKCHSFRSKTAAKAKYESLVRQKSKRYALRRK